MTTSTVPGNNGAPAAPADDRTHLAQAMAAHQRGEVVEELAEQAETMRRALAKLYTAPGHLGDPVWRDDLAFELSTVLQVLNDTVRQLAGDATITLDS